MAHLHLLRALNNHTMKMHSVSRALGTRRQTPITQVPITPRLCRTSPLPALRITAKAPHGLPHQPQGQISPHLHTIVQCSAKEDGGKEDGGEDQRRLTNLGSMIDSLRLLIPSLLQTSLPKHLLLPDVLLRVYPSHFELVNAYLPNIRGHVSYYAACKAAQMFLTSLILNPHAHLHIDLIRTSKFPDPFCVHANSTKIFVRWSTCPEGCPHLRPSGLLEPEPAHDEFSTFSTSNAKLGSHRWSRIDAGQLTDDLRRSWSLADLGKGIIGLKKDDTHLERIISGVFVFELSQDNDTIIVHTVEDMDVVERRDALTVPKLRVC